MKQKKGCGKYKKLIPLVKCSESWGYCGVNGLCLSCSNQNPQEVTRASAEDKETTEDTFNLSDKIDKWFEDYNDMGEEWQIPDDEFNKLANYVKTFIAKLKARFEENVHIETHVKVFLEQELNKLAGDKLT